MRSTRKENHAEVDELIEKGLGREARLRILKFLIKNPSREESLTKYRIAVLTGLKGKAVDGHLSKLVETGWVQSTQINDLKKYRVNSRNPNIHHLIDFFTRIKYV
jgi:DNA-binding transcriptional ArsR family regulator